MILIIIIVLLIAIAIILSLLVALKPRPLTVILDGSVNNDILKVLKIQEDGTIYIPIKRFASYVGYEAYNGKYEEKSEDIYKVTMKLLT